MKDEELAEAFEKVERFIEYRYRKSHANLFLLLGIYFFILLIFWGYDSEILEIIRIPASVFSIGLFILFVFLYFIFVGSGFHLAYKTGLENIEEEEKPSFKRRERISYLSIVVIIAVIFAVVYSVASYMEVVPHIAFCFGMGAANVLIFLAVKKIHGEPHYHGELFWLGVVFIISAFAGLLLPRHFSILFIAFVFLGAYAASAFHIYADARRMLEESVTKEFGTLFSSKSKLSNPVRLGIMILLKRKNKMIFSEIQKVLKLTSGNLNSHLNHLERCGYVSVRKGLLSAGPRTIVEITSMGEEELSKYLSRLKVGLTYREL